MEKDLLKLPSTKKGFLILLALEVLAAAWSVAATLQSARTGRNGSVIYGGITMLAIFYILGRSLRSFWNIVKREREENAAEEKETKT